MSDKLQTNSNVNHTEFSDQRFRSGQEGVKQFSLFQDERNFNEKAFENTRSHEALF